MQAKKLLMMAENIASNFSAYPQKERKAKIKEHLDKFWTKQMRKQLSNHFATHYQDFSQNLKEVMQDLALEQN